MRINRLQGFYQPVMSIISVRFDYKQRSRPKRVGFFVVRAKGIEPIRLSAPDPKSGLSTNFNTPATIGLQRYEYFSFLQK